MSTAEIITVVVALAGLVVRSLLDYVSRQDRRARRRLRAALAETRSENARLKSRLADRTLEPGAGDTSPPTGLLS